MKRIIANFTAFQEFLGFENIIGASWMLPIQITFFIGVCIFGIQFITGKGQTAQRHIILILVMLMSIVVGALRFYTGKPFPTAFCLLIAVALLGINYTDYEKGTISRTGLISLVIEFEVGLVVAVVLSYTDMIFEYLFAYNVGLILFFVAKGFNIYNRFFIKLGEIGFVFFLGAGIPYELLTKFITFDSSLAKEKKIPIVQTLRDYYLMCPKANLMKKDGKKCDEPRCLCRLFRSWYRHGSENVDAVTAPSQYTLNQFLDVGYFKSARSKVIYNAIDYDEQELCRNHWTHRLMRRYVV